MSRTALPSSAFPPDQAAPLVRLRDASLIYGDTVVLSGLNWDILPGRHWAVVGQNGAGKTSLLRMLRGDVRPRVDYTLKTSGGHTPPISWNFEGQSDASPLAVRPYASILSSELQRHYIKQGWRLSGEDVMLSGFGDGYMLYDRPNQAERDAVYAMAARIGAAHLLDALAPDMSQGQLRLVLLGRALMKNPRLLLLDEPCDGLDSVTRKSLFSILEELSTQNTTIVCAIHRGDDVPPCLKYLLELDRGRISARGPLDLAKLPPEPVLRSDSRRSFMPAPILPGAESASTAEDLCKNIFTLANANIYLKRRHILHGINWSVNRGEQWMLSGPNGSGKTTLLRVLLGEEHVAFGGSLKWFGLSRQITLDERRRCTGYVSDWLRNNYGYNLTGRELVLSGLHGSIGLYRESSGAELAVAEYWLERMELSGMAETPLEKMSEGVSRRFLLARAMAPRPKLLILDEPCSGLDGESRARFLRDIPLALEQGSQIIFVSHSASDLAGIRPLVTHELALLNGSVHYCGKMR